MNVQAEFYDGFEGFDTTRVSEVYTSGTVLAMVPGRTAGGQAAQQPTALTKTLGAYTDALHAFALKPSGGGVVYARLLFQGATQLELRWDPATGLVSLYLGNGTLIASVPGSYNAGRYYSVAIAATAKNDTTGHVWVRIAGTVVVNLSGVRTALTGVTSYDGFQVDTTSPSAVDDQYARFGTSGTPEGAYLGDVILVELLPAAQGTDSQWAPDDGSGPTLHYTRYDDPIDDGDGSYIEDGTAGDRDSSTSTPCPTTLGTIVLVQHRMVARKSGSGGGRKIRSYTRDGGGVHDAAAAFDVGSTGYTAYDTPRLVNPNTGVAWLPAEVTAVQHGQLLDT